MRDDLMKGIANKDVCYACDILSTLLRQYVYVFKTDDDVDVRAVPVSILEATRQELYKKSKQKSTNCATADKVAEIVAYLNAKVKTRYKSNGALTVRLINARMAEGFTVADFKQVIDNKVNDWLNDDNMRKYLRPETLFGNKFESYLNCKINAHVGKRAIIGQIDIERREYTEEQLNRLFTPLEEE